MFALPILRTKVQLEIWRKKQKVPINFVPTMGGLHQGHQKLIEVAKKPDNGEQPVVLVSIFINPLQFEADEDFKKYPRDLEKDCLLASKAGANAIWAPTIEEIFPEGIDAHFTIKAPKKLTAYLCGAKREGHFDGVSTTVVRLLKLVQPTSLVLGEKDWQQLIILKKLINNLGLSIKVKNVATFRDQDGLASSSRNRYLSKYDRKKALNLPKQLSKVAFNYSEGKNINLKKVKADLEENDLQVEYLEIVDPENLQPIEQPSKLCLLAAAVQIGKTRLIDHQFIMTRSPIVAIDGPAGAGKSTVTKAFAKKMGLIYLDTGAMYRAITWLIKANQINPEDELAIEKAITNIKLQLKTKDSGDQEVFINNQEVTSEIRSPEVTDLVSLIASHKCVREAMTFQQQQFGLSGGLVAEGRDIGTTVFPNAELKIFLTASSKERARRRTEDLKRQGFPVPNLLELEQQIEKRDHIDSSRKISPLLKAEDAKQIITDGMSIEEVVQEIVAMFRLKVAEEIWPTP